MQRQMTLPGAQTTQSFHYCRGEGFGGHVTQDPKTIGVRVPGDEQAMLLLGEDMYRGMLQPVIAPRTDDHGLVEDFSKQIGA
jgi:hypothetical protein